MCTKTDEAILLCLNAIKRNDTLSAAQRDAISIVICERSRIETLDKEINRLNTMVDRLVRDSHLWRQNLAENGD